MVAASLPAAIARVNGADTPAAAPAASCKNDLRLSLNAMMCSSNPSVLRRPPRVARPTPCFISQFSCAGAGERKNVAAKTQAEQIKEFVVEKLVTNSCTTLRIVTIVRRELLRSCSCVGGCHAWFVSGVGVRSVGGSWRVRDFCRSECLAAEISICRFGKYRGERQRQICERPTTLRAGARDRDDHVQRAYAGRCRYLRDFARGFSQHHRPGLGQW